MSPEDIALMGGRNANSLAQVFIAGYQAAVRRTFKVNGDRWSALAVSEDRSGNLPGLSLGSDGRIHGYKTWVAACDHLDELIVSVGELPEGRLYRVPLPMEAVKIETKTGVGFLAEMSQGIACFEGVSPDSLEGLPSLELKQFARREPLYIYLALCGNLQKRGHPIAEQLIQDLMEVAAGDFSQDALKQRFADADLQIQALFESDDAPAFEGNFEADKGLISLYSAVIQKRAGRG